MSAAALMLSEASPRSCVLPLCISHCWRPSLSGQSSVSSETSASLLECPRENSRPGQGAVDGRRPSSMTAPSPFLTIKAVCLASSVITEAFQTAEHKISVKSLVKTDKQVLNELISFTCPLNPHPQVVIPYQHLFICTICVKLDAQSNGLLWTQLATQMEDNQVGAVRSSTPTSTVESLS